MISNGHLEIAIKKIMQFDVSREDAEFFALIKDNFSDHLGEIVDSVSGDFEGGENEALEFLILNGKEGLRVLGGDMGDMMAMMGAQLVIKYINVCFENYQ